MFSERRAFSLAVFSLLLIVMALACYGGQQLTNDRLLIHSLGLWGAVGVLGCISMAWISVLVSKVRELDERIARLAPEPDDHQA